MEKKGFFQIPYYLLFLGFLGVFLGLMLANSVSAHYPPAPTNFQAISVTCNSIRWGWDFTDIGEPVGYIVETETGSHSVTTKYYDETGLSPNTRHRHWVYACYESDGHCGPVSNTSDVWTLSPCPPGSFTGTPTGPNSIDWSWSANGNPSGTEYYVSNTGGNSGWITNLNWSQSGLTCGTQYNSNLKARDGSGSESGNVSAQATTDACLQPPGAPSNMRHTAQTESSITFRWDAPSSGGPVDHYELQDAGSNACGTVYTEEKTLLDTTCTGSPLTPNTQASLKAKACNNAGCSGWSNVAAAYTDIEKCSGIDFGTVTNDSIQARCSNTPSNLWDGASGLNICNIENQPDPVACSGWKQDNNWWTNTTRDGAGNPLVPACPYTFEVYTKNADGNENTSGSPNNGYKAVLANPPGSCSGSGVSGTQINWSWGANGNGSGCAEYYASDSAGNSGWNTGTSWSQTGLSCGTQYTLTVKARNYDNIENSATVSCSASTAACANNPPNTPSSPDPADGASCVSLSPTLSWTGGDPDGDPVTSKVYYCSGSGCTPSYFDQTNGTSYPLSGLGYDAYYRWQIVADDGIDQTIGPVWDFTTQVCDPANSCCQASGCNYEVSGTSCGTTACAADACCGDGRNWCDYPAGSCTNTCDGFGSCTTCDNTAGVCAPSQSCSETCGATCDSSTDSSWSGSTCNYNCNTSTASCSFSSSCATKCSSGTTNCLNSDYCYYNVGCSGSGCADSPGDYCPSTKEVGNTCYYGSRSCDSSGTCSYASSDTSKPGDWYESAGTCYWGCSVSCTSSGWSRSGCFSATIDDGNACTTDSCVSTGVSHTAVADNTSCGSGNICCSAVCQVPVCSNNGDCNDSDPGTVDTCQNPGTCSASCSNVPTTCSADPDCDDANACTQDVCQNPGQPFASCSNTLYCSGTDADCGCSSCVSCDDSDGWYNTGETRWVDDTQCTEKQQDKWEYRDYSCGGTSCSSAVTSVEWWDNGNTRNKTDGTLCDDGQWCTLNDQCASGVCGGSSRSCSDANSCTVDSCDETNNICVNDPITACLDGDGCCPSGCDASNDSDCSNLPPGPPTSTSLTPSPAYTNTTLTCSSSGAIDPESDPITYHYQFRDTDNSTVLQDWSSTDTFSCSTAGCDKGDTIYCHSIACDDGATGSHCSGEGPTDSQAISNSAPSSFNLLTPSNGATGLATSTNLDWEDSIDADGDPITYYVYYCQGLACSPTYNGDSTTTSAYTLSGLSDDSWYGWDIVADEGSLQAQSSSGTFYFQTGGGGNQPPIANFDFCLSSGTTSTIEFTDTSSDPDGAVISWFWDFGDEATSSLQNPVHDYSVSPGGSGSNILAASQGGQLIENSYCFPGECWDNAFDEDIAGWDGTVTAEKKIPPPADNITYGIFAFSGLATKTINKISLLSDTGVGFVQRWLRDFRFQVSTTGTNDSDFSTVVDNILPAATGYYNYTFPDTPAKYVRLILDSNNGDGSWIQLGELQVYEIGGGGTSFNVSLTATDNGGASDSIVKTVDLTAVPPCSVNQPPAATSLSVVKGDYCASPSHFFSWIYTDPDFDNQSRFDFQVDDNSDFSTPEVDRSFTGLNNPSGTENSQVVLVTSPSEPDRLNYNTTYYWQVKVWDSQGADSGWVQGASFTTENHQYPACSFDWSPQSPLIDELVNFQDTSQAFGGSFISSWSWSFQDGTPSSSSQQNPQVSFGSNGSKLVSLTVTDSDGNSCTKEQNINVQYSLPNWKEIPPQ